MKLPATPSFSLQGRRALVAGGSSGIGLGCAVALAEAGAHVILMARRKEQLDAVVEAIGAAGHSAEALVGDLADIEATSAAIDSICPLDVFVNSAGLARHSPATETAADDFDTVMNVNLRGAYFASQAVAKAMPGGTIAANKTIVVTAGTGGTGFVALQLAKHVYRAGTLVTSTSGADDIALVMSYMGGFVTPVVAFVLPALCYRRMQPLPIDFRLLPLCGGRCLPNCVRASAVLALAALAIGLKVFEIVECQLGLGMCRGVPDA